MTHYQLVSQNKRKSWYVVFGFMGFITAAAYLLSLAFDLNTALIGPALMLSGGTSLVSYWFSDKMVLKMTGAQPATREEHFDFYTIAENLAASQNMPVPKLYVLNTTALNAFATGRNPQNAAVAVTAGLMKKLNRAELEGVIAHELAHVKNYDTRLMSIVTILVGTLATAAQWTFHMRGLGGSDSSDRKSHPALAVIGIFLALLAPFIGQLMQLAISRRREFLADASAVAMTKNPQGLINALQKISTSHTPVTTASTATAHLFISNPLPQLGKKVGTLFMTHPPMDKRIAALKQI